MKSLIFTAITLLLMCNYAHASVARAKAERIRQEAAARQKAAEEAVSTVLLDERQEKIRELELETRTLQQNEVLYKEKLTQIQQEIARAEQKLQSSSTTPPSTGTYTPINEEHLKSIGGINGVEGLTEEQKQKVFNLILNFKLLNMAQKRIDELLEKIRNPGYSDASELHAIGQGVLREIESLKDAEAQEKPTIDILEALEELEVNISRDINLSKISSELYNLVSKSEIPETRKVYERYIKYKAATFCEKLNQNMYLDKNVLSAYGKKLIKEIESFKDEKAQEQLTIEILAALENARQDRGRSIEIIKAVSGLYMIITASVNPGTEKAFLKFFEEQKKSRMRAYLDNESNKNHYQRVREVIMRDPDLFPTAYILLIGPSYFYTKENVSNKEKEILYQKLEPTFRYLSTEMLEALRYVVCQGYLSANEKDNRTTANYYLDGIQKTLDSRQSEAQDVIEEARLVNEFLQEKAEKNKLQNSGDKEAKIKQLQDIRKKIIEIRKRIEQAKLRDSRRDTDIVQAPYAGIIALITKYNPDETFSSIVAIKARKGITDGVKAPSSPEKEALARRAELESSVKGRVNDVIMPQNKKQPSTASSGSAQSTRTASSRFSALLKISKQAAEAKKLQDLAKAEEAAQQEQDAARVRNEASKRKEAEHNRILAAGLEDEDLDKFKEKQRNSFGGSPSGAQKLTGNPFAGAQNRLKKVSDAAGTIAIPS